MTRRPFTWQFLLTVLPLLAGCLAHSAPCGHCPVSSPPPPTVQLPLVSRGQFETDAPPILTGSYRRLTETDCRVAADSTTLLATLLDQESQASGNPSEHPLVKKGHLRSALLLQDVRRASADEARNQSVGTALELLYRLAEAEGGLEFLYHAQSRLDDALSRARELKTRGLKLPFDLELLERQKLDLDVELAQTQLGIVCLNGKLRQVLGVCPAESFWPDVNLDADCGPIHLDEAVAFAVANRPQLRILRQLQAEIDRETLPAIRSMLQSVNGLLGAAPPSARGELKFVGLLHRYVGGVAREVDVRREQITALLADRERAVVEETRQAVLEISTRRQLVSTARARTETLRHRAEDRRDRREQGVGSFLEAAVAELEWWKARGELTHERAAFQMARIKLLQAQGLLALPRCEP